jgi:type II secretory pathway pseudopilin PulG
MRTQRKDAGFSLAALIFFATAASILLAVAVPAYQMQAKREMEEELIFRGEEYMRAIQKYQRRFGIYPPSVEQLISTNGLRFLRRPYLDPVTGKEFRAIIINPDGSLTGSKLFMQNSSPSLFGNTQTFGAQNPQPQNPQQQMQQQMQQAQQQLQQQGQPFSQTGQRGFQSAGQPQAPPGRGGGGGFSPPATQGGQQFPQGQQRGQQPAGPVGGINPAGGTPVAFGGIIGVASDSGEESIKVYNTRQKYDEWEFIAILGQPGQPGQQGQQPNPQQNPQQNQNPQQPQNPFGGQRQNNPFGNAPTNPLGGPPTTSPFGPAGGQRQQPQNPFGFGGPQPPQPQPLPPGR